MPMTMPRATASPISAHEFCLALTRIWQDMPTLQRPSRLGVAVSGGVDSMALSYLCQMKKRDKPSMFAFRAFIVDHRARIESSSEAQKVGKTLRELGIPCTIIRLPWPVAYQIASNPPRFESIARKLRYQALGKACKSFKLSSLLVAHHADDQAETVLCRLLGGYTSYGLQGMQARADIPECYGMWGIDAIGQTNKHSLSNLLPIPLTKVDQGFVGFTGGGIQIYRPLLAFSKERLISTCVDGRIAWVEDSSNKDCSLTIRNTVRKLLNHRQLPNAVQKQALLHLSKVFESKRKRHSNAAKHIAGKLVLRSLDLRSGRLEITIPRKLLSCSTTVTFQGRALNCRIASSIVKSLAQIITHFIMASNSGVLTAMARIFPRVANISTKGRDSLQTPREPKSFTASGVHWHLLKQDISGDLWSLSREPPKRSAAIPVCYWGPDTGVLTLKETLPIAPFGTWQLFDNRYWIQVRDRSERMITVRLLAERDVAYLRTSKKVRIDEGFDWEKSLKELAPGRVRWTLPVMIDSHSNELLALPTLQKSPIQSKNLLEWQILYKTL